MRMARADRPPRFPHLFAERRDAGVARVGEEEQAGGLDDPVPAVTGVGGLPSGHVRLSPRPRGDDGDAKDREHDTDEDRRHPRRAGHAQARDGCHHGDRAHGHRALPLSREDVGNDGECHRRTACDLAGDEAPTGDIAPPRPKALPAVDIRTSGRRIRGGELRRRRGVAVRDDGGNPETDEQRRTSRLRRRGEHGKHACPDHRAEADDHGIDEAEPSRQRGLGGCHNRLGRLRPRWSDCYPPAL